MLMYLAEDKNGMMIGGQIKWECCSCLSNFINDYRTSNLNITFGYLKNLSELIY